MNEPILAEIPAVHGSPELISTAFYEDVPIESAWMEYQETFWLDLDWP